MKAINPLMRRQAGLTVKTVSEAVAGSSNNDGSYSR